MNTRLIYRFLILLEGGEGFNPFLRIRFKLRGYSLKNIFLAIHNSKYSNIIRGFLFALLAIPFFIWGVSILVYNEESTINMLVPFLGILICLFLGFNCLLKKNKIQ